MSQLPAAVIGLAEQIENATGVDLFKAMRPDAPGGGSSGIVSAVAADPEDETGVAFVDAAVTDSGGDIVDGRGGDADT